MRELQGEPVRRGHTEVNIGAYDGPLTRAAVRIEECGLG